MCIGQAVWMGVAGFTFHGVRILLSRSLSLKNFLWPTISWWVEPNKAQRETESLYPHIIPRYPNSNWCQGSSRRVRFTLLFFSSSSAVCLPGLLLHSKASSSRSKEYSVYSTPDTHTHTHTHSRKKYRKTGEEYYYYQAHNHS